VHFIEVEAAAGDDEERLPERARASHVDARQIGEGIKPERLEDHGLVPHLLSDLHERLTHERRLGQLLDVNRGEPLGFIGKIAHRIGAWLGLDRRRLDLGDRRFLGARLRRLLDRRLRLDLAGVIRRGNQFDLLGVGLLDFFRTRQRCFRLGHVGGRGRGDRLPASETAHDEEEHRGGEEQHRCRPADDQQPGPAAALIFVVITNRLAALFGRDARIPGRFALGCRATLLGRHRSERARHGDDGSAAGTLDAFAGGLVASPQTAGAPGALERDGHGRFFLLESRCSGRLAGALKYT
jgi:hypothetical protein